MASAGGVVVALAALAGPAQAEEDGQFRTPSGNIACLTSGRGVVCEIYDYSYAPPERPANCHGAYGDVFSAWDGGPGEIRCHHDRPIDPAQGRVVEYGKTVQAGSVVCTVTSAYLECVDPFAKHGFHLSRESYNVY
ncbi:DUF6636 domain-containing protein [Nocardia yamanashiensis]|uniref:DUF6636 domain-containing protein n=1 Tax=Nocardia yamanashiensis TaxID=209247 RepID=UPI0008311525|nr:DUF6636 domain-containing protein [Nocardia yamanashiensis]